MAAAPDADADDFEGYMETLQRRQMQEARRTEMLHQHEVGTT